MNQQIGLITATHRIDIKTSTLFHRDGFDRA
jgi:hypothetical protein